MIFGNQRFERHHLEFGQGGAGRLWCFIVMSLAAYDKAPISWGFVSSLKPRIPRGWFNFTGWKPRCMQLT